MAKVVLIGVSPQVDRELAIKQLATLFKGTPEQVAKILQKPDHVIKDNVTPEIAEKYKQAIEKAGGLAEIVLPETATPLVSSAIEIDAPPAIVTELPEKDQSSDPPSVAKIVDTETATETLAPLLPESPVEVATTDLTNHREDRSGAPSKRWTFIFDFFDETNATTASLSEVLKSPAYKALSFGQKMKVISNGWAFLFGPLYYFYKKMYAKGAAMLTISWLITCLLFLIEAIIGFPIPPVVYYMPVAVLCSQWANHDYYRLVRKQETLWEKLPEFFATKAAMIGGPIVAMAMIFGILALTPDYAHLTKEEIMADVSGVWRGDTDGAMIEIVLTGKAPEVVVNDRHIGVTVNSIDRQNHIITLGVTLNNGQQAAWVLRQIYDDSGKFTLQMTLHDGTQDRLSFVRNL